MPFVLQEVENKKRNLEEAVDSLNEECAKLKAAEQMQAVSTADKAAEQEQAMLIKGALEQQLDQHREAHQKQVGFHDTEECSIDRSLLGFFFPNYSPLNRPLPSSTRGLL